MSESTDHRWWLPLAAATSLDVGRPLALSYLGEPVVLWRDGDRPVAFTDRCPHRGAQLSLGCVREGTLECPYHGWRFDASGQCTRVPALPAFEPPRGHRVRTWQVQEAFGLLWVAPAGAAGIEPFAPPAPQSLPELPQRRVLCGPFEVATSAPRAVENFLDTAHFGLVHEGWLGSREHLEVPDYQVEPDALGRPGVQHYRAWQPQASASASGGAWVDYRYQLLSPFSALLRKRAQGAMPAEAYALWTTPTGDESCRAWFTIFVDADTPDDPTLIEFQQRIFAQDRPIVESQRPRRLPLRGDELSCAADRLSAAYRRWLVSLDFNIGCC